MEALLLTFPQSIALQRLALTACVLLSTGNADVLLLVLRHAALTGTSHNATVLQPLQALP